MLKLIIPAIVIFLIVLFWEKINEKIYKKFNKLNITEDIKGNTNFVVGEKNLNLIFRSKNYKEFEKFI